MRYQFSHISIADVSRIPGGEAFEVVALRKSAKQSTVKVLLWVQSVQKILDVYISYYIYVYTSKFFRCDS